MSTRKKTTVWIGALSDPELVERVRKNNDDAVTELYNRYHDAVIARAYQVLQDHELAEDAAQLAFMDFVTRVRVKNGVVEKFSSWILTVARHRAIHIRRKRVHQADLFATTLVMGERSSVKSFVCEIPDTSESLDDTCHRQLVLERVSEAIYSLPPRERRALILMNVKGWSPARTAKACGITRAVAVTYAFEGRKKIRERVGHLRQG